MIFRFENMWYVLTLSTFPDFLKSALGGLPEASKNPIALVGYLGALGSWVAIAWRVKRNKQLIRNLDKLPEQDRLKALELEMGGLPLAPGLTPEQWLKARIHRYYFLAFAVVCAVVVVVFAISSFNSKVDPSAPQKDGISQLDLGISRDVVVSKLGVPKSEKRFTLSTCADYRFTFAYVQILYDERREVIYYLVVAKAKDFHPVIPLPYALKKSPCLGCLTFSEFLLQDEDPEPVYFNIGAHIFTYTERVPYYGRASQGRSIRLSYLGAGVDFGSELPKSDILKQVTQSETAYRTITPPAKVEFLRFRSQTKPNAYAVYGEDLWQGAKQFGVPDYLGILSTVGEKDCEGRSADQSF